MQNSLRFIKSYQSRNIKTPSIALQNESKGTLLNVMQLPKTDTNDWKIIDKWYFFYHLDLTIYFWHKMKNLKLKEKSINEKIPALFHLPLIESKRFSIPLIYNIYWDIIIVISQLSEKFQLKLNHSQRRGIRLIYIASSGSTDQSRSNKWIIDVRSKKWLSSCAAIQLLSMYSTQTIYTLLSYIIRVSIAHSGYAIADVCCLTLLGINWRQIAKNIDFIYIVWPINWEWDSPKARKVVWLELSVELADSHIII